jgi:hypothetical protein
MATTGATVYSVFIMHVLAASMYMPAGFRLVLQIIVLVIAVIAARRYQLKGLWFLVAAVFLTVFQDAFGMISALTYRAGNDNATLDWSWLAYLPYVTAVLVLCGWCVLAFSKKQGTK